MHHLRNNLAGEEFCMISCLNDKIEERRNILYITPVLEQRVTKMLISISKVSEQVTVLCPINKRNDQFLQSIPEQVRIMTYRYWLHPQLSLDPVVLASFRKAVDLIQTKQTITHIIYRDVFLFGGFSELCRRSFPNAKHIVDIADNFEFTDGLYSRLSIKGNMQKMFALKSLTKLARADSVIVVCDENKERLVREYKLDKKNVFVVENTPLSALALSVMHNVKKSHSIVYSGQLNSKVRNLRDVLEAIKDTEWTLHLYITNRESKDFRRLLLDINETRTANQVLFHELVPFEKSVSVLSNYELGIIPHNDIGHVRFTLPNKLYDYILAGVPVAAKAVPILESYIVGNKIGFVYSNKEQLKAKILNISDRVLETFSDSVREKAKQVCWESDAEKRFIEAIR